MRLTWRAAVAATLAISLVLPATAGQAQAADNLPSAPQEDKSVSGVPGTVAPEPADDSRAVRGNPAVTWPAAGTAEVANEPGEAKRNQAAKMPIWVGSPDGRSPSKVKVEVLDRGAAEKAAAGVLIKLQRADGVAQPGPVSVEVDYSKFRHAYGGDWATRLRLVKLPACAATTPAEDKCRTGTTIPTVNDAKSGKLRADTTAGNESTVYGVTAAPDGAAGDYKATPVAPAAAWQVSTNSGNFTWAYPMRVPPVPGGFAPAVGLSYSSSAVDGRVAAANNQPSSVGEGFVYSPGFITRTHKSCADDIADEDKRTGDLCWGTEVISLATSGNVGQLIKNGTEWRSTNDNGSKIELINEGDKNESWKVTTNDGTQYFFGSRAEAKSSWTVPVYGNNPGERCYQADFAQAACDQVWRWSLDRAVDRHGDEITYYYDAETNKYGANMGKQTKPYTRGGSLSRIEYGRRDGETAAAKVVFDNPERCAPDTNCAVHNSTSYPDVPWDQDCSADTCPTRISPTFWTTRKLGKVTTQVRAGSGYRNVEEWVLEHSFPAPGDGTGAGLWLKSITNRGLVGDQVAKDPVKFYGKWLYNRVNSAEDGLPSMEKFRLYAIQNESGGVVQANYAPVDCTPTSKPVVEANKQRCFPVRWAYKGAGPQDDWFHKYVVESVVETDRVGMAPSQVTTYRYLDGGAWHFNDNPLIPEARRTWNEWRGYSKVEVVKGDVQVPADKKPKTQYVYFRGMNGDRLNREGGTKAVQIQDSTGKRDDLEGLAGFLREEITFNGDTDVQVSGTISDPWRYGPTATQGAAKAFMVNTGKTYTRTALPNDKWRRTQVDNEFDEPYGTLKEINDLGDVDTTDDDRCTTTTYARNTGKWLLTLPSQVTTVGVPCGRTPAYPRDHISDTRTYYDGKNDKEQHGSAPDRGDPTRVEVRVEDGAYPYKTQSTTEYDGYGRVRTSTDAMGATTTTDYSPATGIPAGSTVTNELGHQVRSELDSAYGKTTVVLDANNKRTDMEYDSLGRLTAVWKPGRSKSDGDGPNIRHSYQLRASGISAISTETLQPNNNYTTSHALFDGFLRERQTQAPAWGGGRVLTDTIYDSRGLAIKQNSPYYNSANPDTWLFAAPDQNIYEQTVTTFDGAARPFLSVAFRLGSEQRRTTTFYRGDSVDVIPPVGNTVTSKVFDARGQLTELRQYQGRDHSGAYDTTKYGYTKAGALATLTDPMNNTWRYTYDMRGRKTRTEDPDKGVSETTFDDNGKVLTTEDARNIKLQYVSDKLGRTTKLHQVLPDGTKPVLAEWTYDTLAKGQLTTSTRQVGTAKYKTDVLGYTDSYQPTGKTVTIPDVQKELAGSYTFSYGYLPNGARKEITTPAAGDLPAEKVTVGYDGMGLPDTLSAGGTEYVTDTLYTKFSEPAQIARGPKPFRMWQTLYYDDSNRRLNRSLVEREVKNPVKIEDRNYGYDQAGNVTKQSDAPGGETPDVQCFGYDSLQRITEAWTTAAGCGAAGANLGGAAPYWSSFAFDQIGNRKTERQHGLNGAADTVREYTYPAQGQARPHAVSSVTTKIGAQATTRRYEYDQAGATKTRPAPDGSDQTLTWDVEGRAETSVSNGKTTTNVYDVDGERIISRDPGGATLYLDGEELRFDESTKKITGIRYYAHGSNQIAVRSGTKFTFTVTDRQGTQTLAVEPWTLVPSRRKLDLFGRPRGEQPASWPGQQGFVGGAADATTGLTHLGARDYDPAIGKFLSTDPLMAPADPQQLNAYSYGNNAPATKSDPSGLIAYADCMDSCGAKANVVKGVPDPGKPKQTVFGYPESKYTYKRSCDAFGKQCMAGPLQPYKQKPNIPYWDQQSPACYSAGIRMFEPASTYLSIGGSPSDALKDCVNDQEIQYKARARDMAPAPKVPPAPPKEKETDPHRMTCLTATGGAGISGGVDVCFGGHGILIAPKIGKGVHGGLGFSVQDRYTSADNVDQEKGWGTFAEGGAALGPVGVEGAYGQKGLPGDQDGKPHTVGAGPSAGGHLGFVTGFEYTWVIHR
ncbi:RHS repeat-associated core domain-containing protein [Actinoplanes sp. NBRC 103695]|uniref:RHS repeat-associated core domain-containing protein n=1 Tax=Actinoplanes sp. NBRC 103695 TaxID=3032202 RepID=UPI0024A2D756|nr:RHS repeat-associated core domain-containing protein [Actinoplanes sp. NBRC 103695]GLY94135.1 type IV secretion protein Rhs [Actinoplanes sp. NBRC 103695]